MKITKTYFMLYATDMGRAVAFYRDAFGLAVRMETPYWSELTWGDATIALPILAHALLSSGRELGRGVRRTPAS